MPDVISWDTVDLCELAGQRIEARCIVYRDNTSSGSADEVVASFYIPMWPDEYSGEQFSYRDGACISEYLSKDEYWSDTGKCSHLKSGDYYFTVQYTGHSSLADSAVEKSSVWHYTEPAAKLAAPTNLRYANGKLSWTQPDGKTDQVVGYQVMVQSENDDSVFDGLYDNKCSVDITSYLDTQDDDYAFTFKVAALSRDITVNQGSEWSDSSAVFHKNESQARSASATGSIYGKEGSGIDAGITLYLTGDSFDFSKAAGYDAATGKLPQGTDLTEYLLLDIPAGGSYRLLNAAEQEQGDSMMAVKIMGAAGSACHEQVNMTISGDLLASGNDLRLTPSDDCTWAITAAGAPKPPEVKEYDLYFFGKQVTEQNMTDIIGDGGVSFDPKTNTLTLNPRSGSFTVLGDTPMLRSGLSRLTLRVEDTVILCHQDDVAIDAKNLTIQIADPSVSLTVIGQNGAFSQVPLNVPEEIFAGADEESVQQKTKWDFDLSAAQYVRLSAHEWSQKWCWVGLPIVDKFHWRACTHKGCVIPNDLGLHKLAWQKDKEPYGAAAGLQHQECQICGYKKDIGTALPGTAPSITTESLLSSELGMAYKDSIKVTGTAPFTWKVTSGSLPNGLSLNGTTGEITGKPTKAGKFTFTVQAANQVPGASPAQRSYTIKIDEASNELKFVKRVTKVSLANADEESREAIENAIYNLLFKAQFRPNVNASAKVGNTGKGKANFTGTKAENYKFTIQNYDFSAGNDSLKKGYINDSALKPVKVGNAGGCNAYALFNTVYTYKTKGKYVKCSKTGKNLTAAEIKEFIHKNVDPGEMLRYEYAKGMHSIVFLGESEDGQGFYFTNYNGGKRMRSVCNNCKDSTYGKTKKCKKCGSKDFRREKLYDKASDFHHDIQVQYKSYSEYAKQAIKLATYDTNGGSYYAKTAKAWKNIGENKALKTIIRLHCPVEASVELNGFILDSEYGPFERSFGTVECGGDGIVFTLDYSEDYVLSIRGTGDGTMDAEIEYLDENDSSLGAQSFENIPITPDTHITAFDMSPETTAILIAADEEAETAWGASVGETASEPNELLLDNNDEPDMSSSNEDAAPDSGSGGDTENLISVSQAVNGRVSVSPATASKGDTVTVTVFPDNGYQLDKLTVTDRNGERIELTDKGNGRFTFTMPDSTVRVRAEFGAAALTEFADVPGGAYYEEAVKWAVENGITTGTGAAIFSPDGVCTRAQAVTFLWRAAGSPSPEADAMPFTDVAADSYYYEAVLWAVENGITRGTSDTAFSPDAKCTRAQIMTFIYRNEQAHGGGMQGEWMFRNPFEDVELESYYGEAVMWAAANGVTDGTTAATFSPNADCTRAQIVTFIWRAMA